MASRIAKRSNGCAVILATATANPSTFIEQSKYPDYLFSNTNSVAKTELKQIFQKICDESGIRKRHFSMNQEFLTANTSICSVEDASLNIRQDFTIAEVPKLAKEAATKAIKSWGQPKNKITHIVFAATSGLSAPGVDAKLIKLLGMSLDTNRVMLYQQDAYAGVAALRIAKDLAENNRGARVLVTSCEISTFTFRAPSEKYLDNLSTLALLGDGAAAFIVGCDPNIEEIPIFEIHSSIEKVVPDSEDASSGKMTEAGLFYSQIDNVPSLVCNNIDSILSDLLQQLNHPAYNDLFWAVHPSSIEFLNHLEKSLALKEDKLQASREVLASFGNMSSASVLYVLDSIASGANARWGIALGYGPGITVEALLLKNLNLSTSIGDPSTEYSEKILI